MNSLGQVDEFMKNNEGLVIFVSRKLEGYLNPNRKLTLDKEDMLQLLRLGLFKAYRTFDDSKGYALATYATRCMYNEFYMFLKSSKAQMIRKPQLEDGSVLPDIYQGSFERKVGSAHAGQNEEFDAVDLYHSVEVDFDKNLLVEELKRAIELLPTKQKEITGLLLSGKGQIEISNITGISQSYVSRLIRNKIIPQIRKQLEVAQ